MEKSTRTEYLRKFFTPIPSELDMFTVDLDRTDLGLADVLRNLSAMLPINSRERNKIVAGDKVIGILCKTELTDPYEGVLFFLVGPHMVNKLLSKKYIIMTVNEERLTTDKEIAFLMDDMTTHLIAQYGQGMNKFTDFFIKFVFDDYNEEFYQDS